MKEAKIITKNLQNKTLYVDMDGTLAEWLNVPLEEVTKKGYFKNLPLMETIVAAVRRLATEHLCEVKILTSVFNDDHSIKEKTWWIRKYIPELEEQMIFVPYGEDKNKYVTVSKDTYLLDDFSTNLHAWEKAGGIAIKCYNGINGTKGTWKGYSVCSSSSEEVVYNIIMGLLIVA